METDAQLLLFFIRSRTPGHEIGLEIGLPTVVVRLGVLFLYQFGLDNLLQAWQLFP